MGMCQPSGGIKDEVGRVGSLPILGPANTRIDLYDENGNLIQQRWYGPDGKVIWDRDWKHGDGKKKHEWPHDHEWKWLEIKPRQNPTSPNYNFC